MKALFFSIALAAALALWGSAPQGGIEGGGMESLFAAGRFAGEQVYNILH